MCTQVFLKLVLSDVRAFLLRIVVEHCLIASVEACQVDGAGRAAARPVHCRRFCQLGSSAAAHAQVGHGGIALDLQAALVGNV